MSSMPLTMTGQRRAISGIAPVQFAPRTSISIDGLMRRAVSAATSAFSRPTSSLNANTCRLRFETSKRSISAMTKFPMPARASAMNAAPPIPPTPHTKTLASLRTCCSDSSTKPRLRPVKEP
jgi:hypothetical protein